MSATFNWSQTYGASPGTRVDEGSSGNLFDFQNSLNPGTSTYADYPIRAGTNSYEVYLQGHFTGTFSLISDVRFWMSTPFSPATGLTIRAKTNQAGYNTPVASNSSLAVSIVPTSDPGSANVGFGGNANSSATTSAWSSFVVLQLQTTTAAPAGETSLAVFTMSYLET